MRRRLVWIGFGLALLMAIGAMAVVTQIAWTQERTRAEAFEQSQREETMRLALWRLDSELAVLLGRQQAASREAWSSPDAGGVPGVRFRYTDGALEATGLAPAVETALLDLLKTGPNLEAPVAGPMLASALTPSDATPSDATPSDRAPEQPRRAPIQRAEPAQDVVQRQVQLNDNAYQARGRSYASTVANFAELQEAPKKPASAQPAIPVGPLTPVWVGEQLVLLRRVGNARKAADDDDEAATIQGLVVDRAALEATLIALVDDLLDEVHFTPADADAPSGRRLAALPFQVAGTPSSILPWESNIPQVLMFSWLGLLGALLLSGVLVRSILVLSDRRATFVGAVTHELRTPLTSMQMYAEMLADGMVRDPERQAHYHRTLHGQTRRLGHLVENVLAYSRLERGRRTPPEPVALGELLERVDRALAPRLALSPDAVVERLSTDTPELAALADPEAVTRILFNLVDNALKYAGAAPTVTIRAEVDPNRVRITVADNGPGVPDALRRRIFRPFEKSVGEAAESAPGIGLGLALSRALAREMGGDLRLERAATGATFVLVLRRA